LSDSAQKGWTTRLKAGEHANSKQIEFFKKYVSLKEEKDLFFVINCFVFLCIVLLSLKMEMVIRTRRVGFIQISFIVKGEKRAIFDFAKLNLWI